MTQLCTLSGVSRWGRRNANRDSLWKALYFERWNDPQSHHAEREGNRLGWKKVYEIKDTVRALSKILSRQCHADTDHRTGSQARREARGGAQLRPGCGGRGVPGGLPCDAGRPKIASSA